MRKQPKWRFIGIIVIVVAVAASINYKMNEFAKQEQALFRDEIFKVEKAILGNLAMDYKVGVKLEQDLIERTAEYNQSIYFAVLDDLIKGKNEQEATTILSGYIADLAQSCMIYSLIDDSEIDSSNLIDTKSMHEIAFSELNEHSADDKGILHRIDSKGKTPDLSSKYYFCYYFENKPWAAIIEMEPLKGKVLNESADKMIADNMLQVSKFLNYDLFIIDDENHVNRASNLEHLGGSLIGFEKSGTLYGYVDGLFEFKFVDNKGKIKHFIGVLTDTEIGKMVVAKDLEAFHSEFSRTRGILWIAMGINTLLSLIGLRMITHNYLYYMENIGEGASRP